jgi:hypothetical protein
VADEAEARPFPGIKPLNTSSEHHRGSKRKRSDSPTEAGPAPPPPVDAAQQVEKAYSQFPDSSLEEIADQFEGLKNKLLIGSESPSDRDWCNWPNPSSLHGWVDCYITIPPDNRPQKFSVPSLSAVVVHPNCWLCLTGEKSTYIKNLKRAIMQANNNLEIFVERPKDCSRAPFAVFYVEFIGPDVPCDADISDIQFLLKFVEQFALNVKKYPNHAVPGNIFGAWNKFLTVNPGVFPRQRDFRFKSAPSAGSAPAHSGPDSLNSLVIPVRLKNAAPASPQLLPYSAELAPAHSGPDSPVVPMENTAPASPYSAELAAARAGKAPERSVSEADSITYTRAVSIPSHLKY